MSAPSPCVRGSALILYDDACGGTDPGLREGTRGARRRSRICNRYLFRDRFGRPGKGFDKGKVEALENTARRRFMVPIPKVDLSVLNERLMARCGAAFDR